MDETELRKQLVEYLLDCLKANPKNYVDDKDRLIPLHKLTDEQCLLIEEVSRVQRKLPSKLKVIELLSKITGLQSTTTKLIGSKENPVCLDFKINIIETDKEDK
jgi:hypothetical protein